MYFQGQSHRWRCIKNNLKVTKYYLLVTLNSDPIIIGSLNNLNNNRFFIFGLQLKWSDIYEYTIHHTQCTSQVKSEIEGETYFSFGSQG